MIDKSGMNARNWTQQDVLQILWLLILAWEPTYKSARHEIMDEESGKNARLWTHNKMFGILRLLIQAWEPTYKSSRHDIMEEECGTVRDLLDLGDLAVIAATYCC